MRIAVFHELHQGGARRAVNELSKGLKKKHTVDLYSTEQIEDKSERSNFSSIYSFLFKQKKWAGGDWKTRLYNDTLALIELYFLHKKIGKVINEKEYDVVFVHPSQYTQSPFILRFLTGKKLYFCQETLRLVYDPLFKIKSHFQIKMLYEIVVRKIRKNIDQKNVSYSSSILSNSLFSQSNIKKAYHRDSIVSYLGVDTEFFKPETKKRDIDILFINKSHQTNDYNTFEDVRYALTSRYKVVSLNNTSHKLSEKELAAYYQRTKIVVCLSRNEPFGLIPLEAGASGCITIALNEGGYKESISNGKTGFLVPLDNKEIVRKVDTILSQPKKIITMSTNARSFILNQWKWEYATVRVEETMKKMIRTKHQ